MRPSFTPSAARAGSHAAAPRWLAALAATLVAASAAQAGPVTFDDPADQGGTVAAGETFTVSQGFEFMQLSGAPTTLFAGDGTGAYASNGTPALYALNNASLSVRSSGVGGRFSIGGFDLGGGNLGFLDPFSSGSVEPWAQQVSVLGTLADSSQLMAVFAVNQLSTGLGARLLNWTGLVDLRFSSAMGDFSLDSLALTQLPEPGALALVALALAGLAGTGGLRRRA